MLSDDINKVARLADVLVFAAFIYEQLNMLIISISDKIILSAVKGIIPETGLLVGEHFHQHLGVPFDQVEFWRAHVMPKKWH